MRPTTLFSPRGDGRRDRGVAEAAYFLLDAYRREHAERTRRPCLPIEGPGLAFADGDRRCRLCRLVDQLRHDEREAARRWAAQARQRQRQSVEGSLRKRP